MLFSYGTLCGMELRHLRYFVMVAEELNISRAAARLRISQPAISRQLRDLEDEVGSPLFERLPTGLTLTPAGELLLAHARDILARTSRALHELKSLNERPAEKIVVAYTAAASSGFLNGVLREFSHSHPNVHVELREMSPTEQVEALRNKAVDVALPGHFCAALSDEFKLTTLYTSKLAVVVPEHHLFSLRKQMRLAELADENFVAFDDNRFPEINDLVCSACQAAGFTPRFAFRANSLSGVFALVAAEKGIALLPDSTADFAHEHTTFVGLRPAPTPITFSAVTRHDPLPPLTTSFLECGSKAATVKSGPD